MICLYITVPILEVPPADTVPWTEKMILCTSMYCFWCLRMPVEKVCSWHLRVYFRVTFRVHVPSPKERLADKIRRDWLPNRSSYKS